jgi:predicted Zn-dependent protease
MFACPSCGADGVPARALCPCGADLTALVALDALPDVWFDRALAALERGAPGEALEWLGACRAAAPQDAGARRALAQVWAQLGRGAEASAALDAAAALDPAAPELDGLRAAIAALGRPAAKKRARARARGRGGRGRHG